MIIETILNCKIKMYVKRINTAVKGAAFVELYGMISLSCFLFLGGGGGEATSSSLYWRSRREQEFLGRVFT